MVFKINVKIPKKRFTRKELRVRKAMAHLYASTPYLTKKVKEKYIKSLFR